MGQALSLDIRKRIASHVAEGKSARSAALRFNVSIASAVRIARQFKTTGRVDPKPLGGKRFSKLEPVGDHLIGLVLDQPDMTLAAMQDHLAEMGVSVHHTSISAFLRKNGFSYKKNSFGFRTKEAPCDETPR